MEAKVSRAIRRRTSIEGAVEYALSHRTRVYILIALNEGTFTAAEIAERIGEPLNNVANHLKNLLDNGSIEVAKTESSGNITRYYYRAIEEAFYTEEDAEAMTETQRQMTAGLVVQGALAEVMAALYSRRLVDPLVWLTWNWFNVDKQGQEEIAAEQARSWDRIREIEVESTNRRASSGEESRPILVTQFGFERAQKALREGFKTGHGLASSPNDDRDSVSD